MTPLQTDCVGLTQIGARRQRSAQDHKARRARRPHPSSRSTGCRPFWRIPLRPKCGPI